MSSRAIEYVYKIIDQYTQVMKKMSSSTNVFKKDIEKAKQKAEQMGQSIQRALKRTAMIGFAALGTGIAYTIKKASEMENVTASFIPLMGGVKKATELVDRLNIEAATTPFQFEQISSVAKQLLPVMNQDIERTAKTFRMLGDTAGGNAQKLDSITRGYTKAMLKGKVDMESLNMIAEAGVPIFTEMADTMGYGKDNLSAMFKEISTGKVSTEILNKTFEKMTSKGGLFFQGMVISSKTLSGVWSTFKDNIAITAASIGQTLLPYIKQLVSKGIEIAGKILAWVQANRELIKTKVDNFIKGLVKTLTMLWKIFSIVYKVIKPFIPIILTLVSAIWLVKKAYMAWLIIQWILNVALTANPIGLIIIAIAALIAIIITLIVYHKQIIAFTVKWYDRLKGLVLIFGGPLAATLIFFIEIIRSIIKHWDVITEKFKSGDILGGLLEIGKAIIDGMLSPIISLLELIGKIPFMKGLTENALKGIDKLKTKLGINIGEDKGIKTPVGQKTTQNVNVKSNISVYTEKGMKVEPFVKRNNLGYQMSNPYGN
jgi:tape measure domain-containing protein